MIVTKKHHRILWYEAAGFLSIIALSWADEMLNLPQLVFGGDQRSNWRESAMETLIVLLVWGVVHYHTRRVVARLYHVEGFLRVCAWCRKLGDGEEWVGPEEYFSRHLDAKTSHGICPACVARMQSEAGGAANPPG